MPDRKVAVVGLGYVGLPLALRLSESGWRVHGIDSNESVVEVLNKGKSHILGTFADEVRLSLNRNVCYGTDYEVVRECDVIVVCVPTPLDQNRNIDLSNLLAAALEISSRIQAGTLIVLESTSYPGTTNGVFRKVLEEGSGLVAGLDFLLGFSPERIDPGNKNFNLINTPKIVSGLTQKCLDATSRFYDGVVDSTVAASSTLEAEFAKLIENSYRYLNIAFVNELAQIANVLQLNIWESIELASTKPFGFQRFFPSAGVGGHCIPVDSKYLYQYVKETTGIDLQLLKTADQVNQGMPNYVVDRVFAMAKKAKVKLSQVLLIGVSYKKDSPDTRESPAATIMGLFLEKGLTVKLYDPHVEQLNFDGMSVSLEKNLSHAISEVDIVVVLQNHTLIDFHALRTCEVLIFDTTGQLSGENVEHL